MTNFLLEIDKDNIFIDSFVFDTYKSIKDYNSFNNKEKYYFNKCNIEYIKYYLFHKYIPVGSIEFTHEYFKLANIEIPKPMNVPINLRRYCTRIIKDISKTELINNLYKYKDYYIKSNEGYKDFEINKVKYFNPNTSKCENYFISSQIQPEIVSEFRCFILSDRIISINNYIGDCVGLDNQHIFTIKEIIKEIKNLRAYTIDFAILENGDIEIIELHHGYSCGNYGFKGDKYLSFLINGINQLKFNKNI